MNGFTIKPRIQYGPDALSTLNDLPAQKVLLVTDRTMMKFGLVERITELWERRAIPFRIWDEVVPDPDIATIVRGMKVMEADSPDLVVALGGGSVIDAAKAMIYVLHQLRPDSALPCFVAVPTTSGTGSEVTSFSVVKSGVEKLVLVDALMLPDIAILAPELVTSVPPAITADTGMDVLCHAVEAFVSRHASDFSDAMAEKAVGLVFSHLADCWRQGDNLLAREKMHNASCMAGIAFTNASLGVTHSLAHALGGMFGIPHGRANTLLMTQVIAFNADYYGQCATHAAQRYACLARLLGLPAATPREGVHSLLLAIKALKEELQFPCAIRDTSIDAAQFEQQLPQMVAQALRDNCTAGNPVTPHAAQLNAIYRAAWDGSNGESVNAFHHH